MSFPRFWLMEFFANVCMHAYMARVEPDQLQLLETLPRLMLTLDLAPRYRSLADLEELYINVGPLNYEWYQFHLLAAAKALYDTGGVAAV